MFQSIKPKSLRGVRHARKFCLHTDASRNTPCSHTLNMQLPCVIAERAIHYSNGWVEKPMKFLVDMLNHTHWIRIFSKGETAPQFNMYKILSWSITQEPLSILTFWCHFFSFSDSLLQDQTRLIILRWAQCTKHAQFGVWGAVPP